MKVAGGHTGGVWLLSDITNYINCDRKWLHFPPLHLHYHFIIRAIYSVWGINEKKKKLMSLLSYPSRFRPFRLPHHFVQSSLYAAFPASATIQFPWASWNFTKLVDSPGEGWVLPYKRLIGICRCMRSHFHNRSDYNGVAFSIDLLEWDRKFSDFWGK